MENRTLWLIDAGYLFKAQRSVAPGYTFDYGRLKAHLERGGPIWRAYYLNSVPEDQASAQDGFHTWLRDGLGIVVKLYGLKESTVGKLYCRQCGRKVDINCDNDGRHELSVVQQKGVDVGLATLALVHMDDYDTLILSSGDGDLLDAIRHVKDKGKRLELAVFDYGVSAKLRELADAVHVINDFQEAVRK